MSTYGLDDIEEKKEAVENTKSKRKAFAIWTVNGQDYKLKLRTAKICQLEEKFKRNLLSLLTDNGIPPLAIMLTVIQAAMQEWEHGIKFTDVQNLFDLYCDDGGSQLTLYTDVIMQIMTVSGFFTEPQVVTMEEKMQEAKELM